MTDPRLTKLAKLLVHYCVEVQPGETVLVVGSTLAEPLFKEVYREAIDAGGHVMTLSQLPGMRNVFYKHASDEQLKWISPVEEWMAKEVDVMIALRADNNTRSMTNIDPSKQRISGVARSELMKIRMQRAATGEQKWTLTQYPTNAYAQEASMSLDEYADFIFGAMFLDEDDPVAKWQQVHDEQQKLIDWLEGKKEVILKGPHCDVTLSIEGRTFINSDGKHNMPSGEIFTGPVEDSVNGWVEFTYPAITGGRVVEGVRLAFENGKVVDASAEKNEEFLLSQLDSDEGARYLGEFAFGTNEGIQQFTGNILFDEKIGGSFHMALGSGYPETGSKNQSAIHWDLICDLRDGGEIYVDGELFSKNGKFVI